MAVPTDRRISDDETWENEARAMHGLPPLDGTETKPPDASDPEQAREAARNNRLAERSIGATIAEMMGVKEVRAVVYRWLDAARAFAPHDFPYGTQIDPLQLARNAAHRELAQFILADLHRSAPNQYLTMLQEAQSPPD